jgi:FkbM family methyltransferase
VRIVISVWSESIPQRLPSIRRVSQVALARFPRLYDATLRAVGRGSAEKKAYLRVLRRGDIVLDIGANDGYFTLLFSDLVGARGRVLGFEPIGPTCDRLLERVARDAWFDNVEIHRAACGETDGIVEMFVPGADWGQASLVRQRVGSWATARNVSSYEVRQYQLDTYLKELRSPPVNFVKIDAEGGELPVLRGLRATMAAHPPLLALELYGEWTRAFGYGPRDLLQFVADAGYDRFMLVAAPLRNITLEEAAARAESSSINVLCGVRARHGLRLADVH